MAKKQKQDKAPKGFVAWDKKEDKMEMAKKGKGGKGKGRKGC